MCIALLLIYGLYCLLKDFVNWLGYKATQHNKNKPIQHERVQKQRPISNNEILTFEELLEDDE